MVKGLLVGLLIMVVCPLIPIAHFVLVPASPFIAGYWGIHHFKKEYGHYAVKGIIFGSILALLFCLILVAVAYVLIVLVDIDQRIARAIWIGVVVFTLYTASMGTLGAMFSSLREIERRKRDITDGPTAGPDGPESGPGSAGQE